MLALRQDSSRESIHRILLAGLVLVEIAWLAFAGAFLWDTAGDSIFGDKNSVSTAGRFIAGFPLWLSAAWLAFGLGATWLGAWSGLWQSIIRAVALTSIPAVNLAGIALVFGDRDDETSSLVLIAFMFATVIAFVWFVLQMIRTGAHLGDAVEPAP